MATDALLTIADFLSLSEPEDRRYELNEGQLVVVEFPEADHNRVVRNIWNILNHYARRTHAGQLFPFAMPCVLDETRGIIRKPDISFIKTERLSGIPIEECIYGAPDLVVDVKCPRKPADTAKRVEQFLAAGVKSTWSICPKTFRVDVYDAAGTKRRYEYSEIVEVPDVLPEFAVPVEALFEVF